MYCKHTDMKQNLFCLALHSTLSNNFVRKIKESFPQNLNVYWFKREREKIVLSMYWLNKHVVCRLYMHKFSKPRICAAYYILYIGT